MKKTITVCVWLLLPAWSFSQKQPQKVNPVSPSSMHLASGTDSMQYILGAFLAQWINSNGFVVNNAAVFLQGMEDVFRNRPRAVPDSVIGPSMAAYLRSGQKEIAAKQEQQLFAALRNRPGIGMLPNGVGFVVIKQGRGSNPQDTDTVVVHLTAKLINGTMVENTYQSGKPFITTASGFFPGLNDALQMMPAGSKWQLFIPSILAYGDRGTALIPPNNSLILEVELLETRAKK